MTASSTPRGWTLPGTWMGSRAQLSRSTLSPGARNSARSVSVMSPPLVRSVADQPDTRGGEVRNARGPSAAPARTRERRTSSPGTRTAREREGMNRRKNPTRISHATHPVSGIP